MARKGLWWGATLPFLVEVRFEEPKRRLLCSLREHLERVVALAWAPDSMRIATVDRSFRLQLWNVLTGQRYATFHQVNEPVDALAWGNRCIVVESDSAIYVLDAATGAPLAVCPLYGRDC
jgi:WD40 repeat protein